VAKSAGRASYNADLALEENRELRVQVESLIQRRRVKKKYIKSSGSICAAGVDLSQSEVEDEGVEDIVVVATLITTMRAMQGARTQFKDMLKVINTKSNP
jgi:hypothetical protein